MSILAYILSVGLGFLFFFHQNQNCQKFSIQNHQTDQFQPESTSDFSQFKQFFRFFFSPQLRNYSLDMPVNLDLLSAHSVKLWMQLFWNIVIEITYLFERRLLKEPRDHLPHADKKPWHVYDVALCQTFRIISLH